MRVYVCMPKKFGPNTNVSETVFVQVGTYNVNLQTWETRVIKKCLRGTDYFNGKCVLFTHYCEKSIHFFVGRSGLSSNPLNNF